MQNIELYIVLHMPGHGNAERENQLYGGAPHYRYLNVTWRWSAAGTKTVPLLAWPSVEAATEAAKKASVARSRPVKISSLGNSEDLSEKMRFFSGADAAALTRVAQANDKEESKQAIKPCGKELHAFYGGGSVASAVQFFTGNKAASIIEGLLDGELEFSEGMSLKNIEVALTFAKLWEQRDNLPR